MRKIVIAADTYFPKKDGVTSFLRNVVPRLAKHYFVTLLVPDFDGKGKFFDIKNINEIRFPIDKKRSFGGYNFIKKTKKLHRIMKREIRNCDLVFSQDIAYIGRKAVKYARDCKKPSVSYVHQITWDQLASMMGDRFSEWFWKAVAKIFAKGVYRKSSMLCVPSRKTAWELKRVGVDKEKAIIHLGVDLEKFKPPKNKSSAKVNIKISPEKNVIGYAGRVSREKNLSTLRQAFLAVKEKYPDAVLLIAGGGSEEEIKELKNTEDTIITGFVKDVSPYLRAMDIFVLPSLTETTSLVTMEAMACSVPVITTNVGRLPEYVRHNINGYLFRPRDAEALKKYLEKLLSDPRRRMNMAYNARKDISNFSWDSTVQGLTKVFEGLFHQT